jgi:hypothetical protein
MTKQSHLEGLKELTNIASDIYIIYEEYSITVSKALGPDKMIK